jgi:hypothetical protein
MSALENQDQRHKAQEACAGHAALQQNAKQRTNRTPPPLQKGGFASVRTNGN